MISIIIPVYNTSQWLPQCLDSVLKQDYQEIEIIVINDASTDASLEICERYAYQDNRILIIDKSENEGLESARRSGLAVAKGEYIMHIDSDDWLDHPGVLSMMYQEAEYSQSDYVEIGMNRVLDRHRWVVRKSVAQESSVIDQPELFDKYFISFFGVNLLSVNMCGKLYRKSVLKQADIKPIGVYMGEDLAYNLQLFPYLRRICILAETGYNYRIGGGTGRYNPHLLPDLKRLYLLKKELIERYQYHKATNYIHYELKNVLKSDICQRIAYGGERSEIVAWIREEIDDPIYAGIWETAKASTSWNDPFKDALIAKDVKKIYELCRKQVRREAPKRILKRVGFGLLNLI